MTADIPTAVFLFDLFTFEFLLSALSYSKKWCYGLVLQQIS